MWAFRRRILCWGYILRISAHIRVMGWLEGDGRVLTSTVLWLGNPWGGSASIRCGAMGRAPRDRCCRYRSDVAIYTGVNTLLIGINIATAGAITWAIYPLLGWGIGLCLGPCKAKAKPLGEGLWGWE